MSHSLVMVLMALVVSAIVAVLVSIAFFLIRRSGSQLHHR
jgi:hypothetical protein